MTRIFSVLIISLGFLTGCENAVENYLFDIETAKLLSEIEEDARQGNADAQYNLALRCAYGIDVPIDFVKSIYWHTKAAEQGNAEAQYTLAVQYDLGDIITKDYSKAVYWYTKSAIQGHADAQFQLGGKYLYGKGIPKDIVLAYAWFNIAQINGLEDVSSIIDDGEEILKPEQLREIKAIATTWKVGETIKHESK